jgi:hypothetical protein
MRNGGQSHEQDDDFDELFKDLPADSKQRDEMEFEILKQRLDQRAILNL